MFHRSAGRPSALGRVRLRRRDSGRAAEAAARAVPRRGTQQAAIGVFDSAALIQEFRGEEDSRLGLVGAFGYDLLFQFEPIEKKLPRAGHKDLHLFLCDDICFMDRKKEQIERYQYDFEREGACTRGPGARWRSDRPAGAARRAVRLSAITRRKSTWPRWRRCGKACAAAIITKWCCGRLSARRTRGKASRSVPARAAGQPQPLRIPAAIRRRATGGRVAGDVRAGGRRSAWRRAPSRAPRSARAIPLRDADNIRELLKSYQGRIAN